MDLGGNLRTRSRTEGVLGDVSTATRYNQCEINFAQGINAALITDTTDGTYGSVTATTGMGVFSTGANAAGWATGISTQTLEYRPAHEFYAMFTALFTMGVANSFQRIGPFNTVAGAPQDGWSIGYEGATFYFTQYQNGVAIKLAQSSWNGDPCNGSAGSLFTSSGVPIALNFQKINIWRISGSWFGTGPILLEILSPDAEFVTLHTYHYPDTLTTPTTYTNNYNMAVMVSNAGGNTSNVSISVPCIAMGTLSNTTKITDTLTDYTLAQTVRSVLTGKYVTGGAYLNVGVDSSGNLLVDQSYIANNPISISAPDIQKVGITGHAGANLDSVLGAALPPNALLVAGSDGTNLQPLKMSPWGVAPTGTVIGGNVELFACNSALYADGSGNLKVNITAGTVLFPATPNVWIEGHAGAILDAAPGATAPTNALQVAGVDYNGNTEVIATDTTGKPRIVGATMNPAIVQGSLALGALTNVALASTT